MAARRARDPEKVREYQREWRAKNLERTREYQRKRSRTRRRYIQGLKKATPCVDCGIHFHFSAMDFDHVRGTKRFNVGEMSSCSPVLLKKEIEKCDVVCANCHRVRTWKRKTGQRI